MRANVPEQASSPPPASLSGPLHRAGLLNHTQGEHPQADSSTQHTLPFQSPLLLGTCTLFPSYFEGVCIFQTPFYTPTSVADNGWEFSVIFKRFRMLNRESSITDSKMPT